MQRTRLTVAVAANALPALQEIEALYEAKRPDIDIVLSSGSSGTLMRQVREGAPFDIFLSANDEYTRRLASEGFLLPDSVRLYAEGKLVVIKAEQRPEPIPLIEELATEAFPVERLTIANPEHAPYGTAAREAFRNAGAWDRAEKFIVYGENVGQAFQYVSSGNADAGLVPLSLAIANGIAYREVTPGLYAPIVQSGGILAEREHVEFAREFMAFLSAPPAVSVFERYGYGVPEP